jgi:hypothetical protein
MAHRDSLILVDAGGVVFSLARGNSVAKVLSVIAQTSAVDTHDLTDLFNKQLRLPYGPGNEMRIGFGRRWPRRQWSLRTRIGGA